jgi:hypothetical protein
MTLKEVHAPSLNRNVKFGRKPSVAVGPHFRLRNYLRASMPTAPASFDYGAKAQASLTNIYGNDNLGDCHDAKTEVLTTTGWQAWMSYDGRTPLGTMNQATGMLEFQAPTSITRREHRGPMAFSAHKRLDFGLTPNHRMLVKPYHIPKPYIPGASGYGEAEFRTIDNLPARSLMPGATTGFLGTTLEKLAIGNRSWAGDDFMRLLAVVMSDGFASDGETNRSRISFCCFREDRREMVAAMAYRLGINESVNKGVWEFRNADLAEWLRVNAYDGDVRRSPFKRVPELVKVASQEQIEEFLRFFGDQHIDDDGDRAFYSSSPRLVDDLQELLLRIGKRGSIYKREPRLGGVNEQGARIQGNHPDYTLTENRNSDITLLKGSKRNPSLEWDHYDGEVFCATVPNSTLVTRRNGSVLISGNCVIAGGYHVEGVATGNADDLFVATQSQIVSDYSAIGGYVPGDDSTDQGCDLVSAMNYWTSHGFANGTKLLGWLSVDGTNATELAQACYLFESLYFGMELPDAWVNPFPSGDGFTWDAAGDPVPSNGHCVMGYGANSSGVIIDSWAMRGVLTFAAIAKYAVKNTNGEVHVMLTPDLLAKGVSKTPCGLAWADMLNDFNSMGGNVPIPAPVPAPGPVPAPPPPGPKPSPTGVTLAQAQQWAAAAIANGPSTVTRQKATAEVNAGLAQKWPK